MERLQDLQADLTCPICQDLFTTPITVPCCTKAFCQLCLAQCLEHQKSCPLCKGSLDDFDPMQIKANNLIASMVDSYRKLQPEQPAVLPMEPIKLQSKWSASCAFVHDKTDSQRLPVAQLCLNLEEAQFVARPSLFIAVVDRSGSMGGAPWKQVETALLHIMSLSRNTPFVKIVIIAYDSNAEIINTSGTEADVHRVIRNMFTGGGTNFRAAFTKVKEVLLQYECDDNEVNNNNNVSNITVAFLTDGQADGDRAQRMVLVEEFDKIIKSTWSGPITVHSIGFGSGCDKELLEGLWKVTPTGTFRYAEPQDNGDTLCGKLTNLFEIVSKASTIPITLKLSQGRFKRTGANNISIQFPIGVDKSGQHCEWVCIDDTDFHVTLNSALDKDLVLKVSVDNKNIFTLWLAKCIDDVASELLELGKQDKVKYGLRTFDLHAALLQQKCRAMLRVNDDNTNRERLQFLLSQIEALRAGLDIHLGKVADLRFGSQYAAISNIKVTPQVTHKNVDPVITQVKVAEHKEPVVYYSRNNKDKKRNELQCAIVDAYRLLKVDEIKALLARCTQADIDHIDTDGNDTLMLACYCGQYLLVKQLLAQFKVNLTYVNNAETAMTLAIKKQGFWQCVKVLLEASAEIPKDRIKALEQFAIDHGFSKTAAFIANFTGSVNTDINDSMSPEYIMFTYERMLQQKLPLDVPKYLTIALRKQMWSLVKTLVTKHAAVPTTLMLMDYCIPDCNNLDKCPDEYLDIGIG